MLHPVHQVLFQVLSSSLSSLPMLSPVTVQAAFSSFDSAASSFQSILETSGPPCPVRNFFWFLVCRIFCQLHALRFLSSYLAAECGSIQFPSAHREVACTIQRAFHYAICLLSTELAALASLISVPKGIRQPVAFSEFPFVAALGVADHWRPT